MRRTITSPPSALGVGPGRLWFHRSPTLPSGPTLPQRELGRLVGIPPPPSGGDGSRLGHHVAGGGQRPRLTAGGGPVHHARRPRRLLGRRRGPSVARPAPLARLRPPTRPRPPLRPPAPRLCRPAGPAPSAAAAPAPETERRGERSLGARVPRATSPCAASAGRRYLGRGRRPRLDVGGEKRLRSLRMGSRTGSRPRLRSPGGPRASRSRERDR